MTGFPIFVIIAALTTALVAMRLEPSQLPTQKKLNTKKIHLRSQIKSWILLAPGIYSIDGKKLTVKKGMRLNLHGKTPWIVPREN